MISLFTIRCLKIVTVHSETNFGNCSAVKTAGVLYQNNVVN